MKPTAHIEVTNQEDIAKTVLMPGDPLRAKFIADTFLKDVKQFNTVRGMLGFTGTYNGKKISVMGSGMGMPSIGIYSYELFKFYDVDNIIRIGSCGSYDENINLYDVIIASDAWSESSYRTTQSGKEESEYIKPSQELNNKIKDIAKDLKIELKEERIHSSDVFYRENFDVYKEIHKTHGCKVVEMEAFALFHNANVLNKNAACILTVSDSLVTHEATTSEERQNAFTKMMELALEL